MSRGRPRRRRKRSAARSSRWSRPVLLSVAGVAVVASLHVWFRLQTTAIAYELEELHRIERRLAHEGAELEVELARRTSPQNLDRVARERLGLRPPRAGQVVGVE